MNIEELIEEIKKAFKEVKLGGGIGLLAAEALNVCKWEELKNVIPIMDVIDERENWENISYENLHEHNCSLTFTDAEGLRFLLPAYLIYALNDYTDALNVAFQFDCYPFNQLSAKFSLFEFHQMVVVIKCIEHFKILYGKYYRPADIESSDVLISNLIKIKNTKRNTGNNTGDGEL